LSRNDLDWHQLVYLCRWSGTLIADEQGIYDPSSTSDRMVLGRRVSRANAVVSRLLTAGDEAPNGYGVNTGFGALAETRVAASAIRALRHNLVLSHACGVGPDLSPRIRSCSSPEQDCRHLRYNQPRCTGATWSTSGSRS
jgi:hypothetical protein